MKLSDVQCDDKDYISLSKLTGRKIKDIVGYLSSEWGDAHFVPCRVYFEDGQDVFVEGEHDHPYIVDYGFVLPDEETMESLYKEENPDEDDEEDD